MIEMLELTFLGENPITFHEDEPESSDVGWCILKRRPRGGEDENGHLISEPDETIFYNMDDEGVIGNNIGNGIPFMHWWPTFDRINAGNQQALEYGRTFEAQKFNNDQGEQRTIDTTKPINIRCTGDGGNLKQYYLGTQTATHIQIVAFDYRYPVDAEGKDFYTHPWLFTFPTAINSAGRVTKVANGLTVFFPQIERKETGLWIRKSEVIFLDRKPDCWGIQDVMMSGL